MCLNKDDDVAKTEKENDVAVIAENEEIADILLDKGAVKLAPEDPFRFASGMLSPIYCDNRILLSYTAERDRIIGAFINLINKKNLEFDMVAGVATAGIPHSAILADRLNKPMIYVRAKKKDHGKQNRIEGDLKKGAKVLVIEDLISTGGSSAAAIEAIRENGGVVTECLSIFTYSMKKAEERFSDIGCNMFSLTSFPVLISVAQKKGYISSEDEENVLLWKQSPEEWADKHKTVNKPN